MLLHQCPKCCVRLPTCWQFDAFSLLYMHCTPKKNRPAWRPAGTSSSHADFQGEQPPPGGAAYGIALLGNRMHTLIPANTPLPASAKQAGTLAGF